jgi:putative ATP-binding cassette transporter
MKLLSFMARYSRKTVVLAIVAGAVSGICNTALLALINQALHGINSATPALVWGFVAMCALLPLSRFVSELLLTQLGQNALFDLRVKLSRKILNAPLRQLEELGAHRLLAALTDDVPVITNALLNIPIICINVAVVLGGLAYLGWLSGVMMLAVLGFMLLGILSYQLPLLKAIGHFKLARERGDALMQNFRALTEGTKELKLHHERREAFLTRQLRGSAAAYRDHNVRGMSIHIAAASWGQVLVFVVVGLTIFLLPHLRGTDVQTLTGYTLILLYLMTPLQVLMNVLPALGRAGVAINKVEQLGLSLLTDAAHVDAPGGVAALPAAAWNKLELIKVAHSYRRDDEETNFVVGPVDLTIKRGDLVFLVGGNGSGKTTLAKVLLGLYVPDEGEIRLDGRPVTDENREAFRQSFSVVFSDFYLFESLLGLDDPQLDARARNYLVQLHLDAKVKIKDGALSTTELSQGQRKRLALLTAYLEDRPVYLFDEWAADQDPMFKEIFYYNLLPELKERGKTVIVISHDDRYYHVADRIIKMDSGKVTYDLQASSVEQWETEMVMPIRP